MRKCSVWYCCFLLILCFNRLDGGDTDQHRVHIRVIRHNHFSVSKMLSRRIQYPEGEALPACLLNWDFDSTPKKITFSEDFAATNCEAIFDRSFPNGEKLVVSEEQNLLNIKQNTGRYPLILTQNPDALNKVNRVSFTITDN